MFGGRKKNYYLRPAGIEPAPSDVGVSQTCYRYTRVLDSNTNRLACLICLTYALEKCLANTGRPSIIEQGEGLSLYRGVCGVQKKNFFYVPNCKVHRAAEGGEVLYFGSELALIVLLMGIIKKIMFMK